MRYLLFMHINVVIWNLGGTDYSPGLHILKFSAGITSASFEVSISDTTFEDNENFYMTVDRYLLPRGITVGSHAQTLITIIDDDRK